MCVSERSGSVRSRHIVRCGARDRRRAPAELAPGSGVWHEPRTLDSTYDGAETGVPGEARALRRRRVRESRARGQSARARSGCLASVKECGTVPYECAQNYGVYFPDRSEIHARRTAVGLTVNSDSLVCTPRESRTGPPSRAPQRHTHTSPRPSLRGLVRLPGRVGARMILILSLGPLREQVMLSTCFAAARLSAVWPGRGDA